MPDHKSQHYVPKCHLKPFSVHGDGKAIHLLNIRKKLLIENASVRSQCAKDYFYGRDLVLERRLQEIEGTYASIIRNLAENTFSYDDLQFIRDFCYLQYLRTDIAARRQLLALDEMKNLAFERTPESLRPASLSQEELVREAIDTFAETVDTLEDLKVCLVKNKTSRQFITSDDPAVLLNRFYSQRLGPRWKSFGIGNAGVMFILPLSPGLLMYSYDGDVYTCPEKKGHVVEIDKDSDVAALNMVQHMKASDNLYFHDWVDGERIRDDFSAVQPRRPEKWHNIHFAVKDDEGSTADSTRYKVVHTKEERVAADEAFVHLQSVMLEPVAWFSKIRFRQKPKYVYTGTGAGYKRHRAH